MSELRERVAYLSGLVEGMGLKDTSKEGRVFTELVGVLDDMADAIIELAESQEDMEEYVEDMDEDLSDLEEHIGEDDEEVIFEFQPEGEGPRTGGDAPAPAGP